MNVQNAPVFKKKKAGPNKTLKEMEKSALKDENLENIRKKLKAEKDELRNKAKQTNYAKQRQPEQPVDLHIEDEEEEEGESEEELAAPISGGVANSSQAAEEEEDDDEEETDSEEEETEKIKIQDNIEQIQRKKTIHTKKMAVNKVNKIETKLDAALQESYNETIRKLNQVLPHGPVLHEDLKSVQGSLFNETEAALKRLSEINPFIISNMLILSQLEKLKLTDPKLIDLYEKKVMPFDQKTKEASVNFLRKFSELFKTYHNTHVKLVMRAVKDKLM